MPDEPPSIAPRRERELGRPRSFTDVEALIATQRVLLRDGAQGVTLAAVARELSCTGQALNARFGSRKELLIAYSEWASERQLERFRQVRGEHASPLRGLRARFELPLEGREDELAGAGTQLHLLSFAAEARQDSDFAERYEQRGGAFENEVASLIRDAVTQGELSPDIDPGEVAHLMISAMSGATARWSVLAQGSVVDEVLRIFDCTITPYLVSRATPRAGTTGHP